MTNLNKVKQESFVSRFMFRLALAVGALVLSCIAAFIGWRVHLGHVVDAQFAELRAKGLPTSGAELNHWLPAVPDSENGALALINVFAVYHSYPDDRSNEISDVVIRRTNRWSEHTIDLVGGYVQMNEPTLSKAREAVGLSKFRYPLDYSEGMDSETLRFSALKGIAGVSGFQAVLDADAGRSNDWPGAVKLELKLAESLDNEPTLLSQLVRISIVRTAVRVTERCVAKGCLGEAACKDLQSAFAECRMTNLIAFGLIGERAMAIPTFRFEFSPAFLRRAGAEVNMSPSARQFIKMQGIFERDLSFYLDTMKRGIETASKPPPQSLAMTNDFETAAATARKKFYVFSAMLLPSVKNAVLREAQGAADVRLAMTALAVERYRLAHGRLPKNLEELTPQFLDAVPTDPFDGAPLRYKPRKRGYVIYSIGADGKDDGGRETPPRHNVKDNSTYDITFIVER